MSGQERAGGVGGEGRRGEHHKSHWKKGEVTGVGEELMKGESEDGT